MQQQLTVSTKDYSVRLEGDTAPFKADLNYEKSTDGVEYLHLILTCDSAATPPQVSLVFDHAMVNTHHFWTPAWGPSRNLGPQWNPSKVTSKGTVFAPVIALYDIGGTNTLTFALSDCMNTCSVSAGVVEETASAECKATLFIDPIPPTTEYTVTLRLDSRRVPWYQSLQEVSRWWETLPGYAPGPVPEHARLPLYSSWYSFHQRVTPERLEEQCRLAKQLGMETIIVDDGWQTDDNSRGYAFCGDWEVTQNKMPDFAEHVKRVHAIGMKYMLWFSVPFIGKTTKAYQQFADKALDPGEQDWFILDPRFPEVREYLIGVYEGFVRRYDIDGFKLDFVDSFNATATTRDLTDGRDYASVPEAVDRLLMDAKGRLEQLKPGMLIEFRQSYIGPLMRKYGNMLRAGDVPNDFGGNRLHIVDIRLLCGSTAAHSDMFMWNPEEPVESAAMQIIHTLFSVPQVSVMLDEAPDAHQKMIGFLLKVWRENRDVLLDGEFMPQSPEMLYPVIAGRTETKLLLAAYCKGIALTVAEARQSIILVNGTFDDYLTVDWRGEDEERMMEVVTCTGDRVTDERYRFTNGVHRLSVPAAGMVFIR